MAMNVLFAGSNLINTLTGCKYLSCRTHYEIYPIMIVKVFKQQGAQCVNNI